MQDELLLTKREILAIIFRRKWQMLGIFVASIGIAAFFAYYLISPSYETKAQIIINPSYLTQPLRDAPPETSFDTIAWFHSQRDIIESTRMAAEAVRRTHLADHRVIGHIERIEIFLGDIKRFVGRLFGIERWSRPWDPVAAAVAEVDDWVHTAAVPDSKVIQITYRAKDPHEAVEVLDAILDAEIDYYYGTYRERAEGVAQYLQHEYDDATSKLHGVENKLLQFRLHDRMDARKLEAAARLDGGSTSFVGLTDSTKVQDELKLYVLKLEEDLRVAEQISDNERRERTTRDLQRRIQVYLDALNSIPQREVRLVNLQREYDAANENVKLLERNLTRAKMVASDESQKVRLLEVFEHPTFDDNPVAPKKRLIMMLSALLGAVLAFTWAVTANYLDHTVRTAQDVDRYLGLRLIGSLGKIA